MDFSSSNQQSVYAYVGVVGSSCLGGNWAGLKYRFDLYDGTGYRGWYLTSHVNDNGAFQYTLYQGQFMSDDNLIGWTYRWAESSCYVVKTDAGVHWHIEAYQPVHYSCYYPHASGTYLGRGDVMGAAGSDATYAGAPCW